MSITSGVYYDMTDDEYHEQHDFEEHFFSSSQLKTVDQEGAEVFHQKYVTGEIEKKVSQQLQDAFDIGTVAHTAVLEPDKLKSCYAKWTGGNRTGKQWQAFKKANEGKLIMSKIMVDQASRAIVNVRNSPLCSSYFNEGQAEVSFFVEFMGLKIKVRTDWLGQSTIVDLKTANGNMKDEYMIKNKVKDLGYDLSAALYVDVVNACIEFFELDIPYVESFIWIFTSKNSPSCQAYDAREYLPLGRKKYKKAIKEILRHQAAGWEFKEELIVPKPFGWETLQWADEKESKTKNLTKTAIDRAANLL